MRVSLKPPSSARIDSLVLDGEPTYGEQVPGGYTTATVRCVLDLAPRLVRDGRVWIRPTHGRPWVGTVDSVQTDNGITTLVCVGGQAAMRDRVAPRAALYCDTSLTPWQERTLNGRNLKLSCEMDVTRLRISMESGVAIGTKNNGWWRLIPSTTASTLKFSWKRPSTSIRLQVFAGPYTGDEDSGDEILSADQWTAWTQTNGSGSLSGTATVSITGAHDCIQIVADAPSGYTPGGDYAVTLSGIKVYGVAEAQTVPMTHDVVVSDVASRLAPWFCSTTTAYIEADSTAAEPFALDDVRTTEQDIIEQLMTYTDRDFGVWSRIVNGEDVPVLVYSSRATTPSYQAYVDGFTVEADYAADGTDDEPTHVMATYETADGRTVTTTATPTIPPWGAALGYERHAVIDVDTTSASDAALIAEATADAPSPAKGSVVIRGLIADANGGAVYPSEIEAGRIMRLHDSDRGTLDARIVSVEKVGESEARCEFDNTPARIDAWLIDSAKLARAAQRLARRR